MIDAGGEAPGHEKSMLDQAEALREMVDRIAGDATRTPTPETRRGGRPAPSLRTQTGHRPGVAAAAPPAQRAEAGRDGVVAIASGKGGVGKTTVTVSLAAELVRRGRRVLVLDADFGTANVDVACGLCPEATLSDVLRGTHQLGDILLQAPGGFHLLPGASGLTDTDHLPHGRLRELFGDMEKLEAAHDMILIDVGAGVGPVVRDFCAAAGRLLVVTTPDPTAITDAYALLKTLSVEQAARHASVVVNMVASGEEGRLVHERLDAACRHFLNLSPPLAGIVPMDPAAAESVRRRIPLLASEAASPAGRGLQRLASTLDHRGSTSQVDGQTARTARKSLFRRLLQR